MPEPFACDPGRKIESFHHRVVELNVSDNRQQALADVDDIFIVEDSGLARVPVIKHGLVVEAQVVVGARVGAEHGALGIETDNIVAKECQAPAIHVIPDFEFLPEFIEHLLQVLRRLALNDERMLLS